ncbi:MAG: hypothetical protein RMA76_37940 [Deltaproteobacteria bacterium]|jgi:hypothetical protein
MADPLSSGAAKVAEEMMKEVESAMKQADQLAQAQETPNVEFNNVLNSQRVGEVQEARINDPGSTDVLRAARTAQVAPPAIGNSIDTKPLASGLQRIMEDVMQGQNKLEEIINLSLSGRNFSTPELLAMQAGVYRFTQELELTSKVVEKATATIKQTMNTQV